MVNLLSPCFLQCTSDKHRPVVYCKSNRIFFYSVYSFLLFLITRQTVALLSLKSIMFSRVPVVFLSILDAHVAGNSFIVQFCDCCIEVSSQNDLKKNNLKHKFTAKMAVFYHTSRQLQTVTIWRESCAGKKKKVSSALSGLTILASQRQMLSAVYFLSLLYFWFYLSWVSLIIAQTEQFLTIHHFMVNNNRTQGSEMENGVSKSRLLHGPAHSVITQSIINSP